MNKTKPALKSKTIWGNIISILATVAGVGVMTQTGIPVEVLTGLLTAAAGSIGGNVLSVFGRYAATKEIR
jgi:hypothetical protein